MESVDFQREELVVPEAIGLTLHGFDLVVRPLQRSGGNFVFVLNSKAKSSWPIFIRSLIPLEDTQRLHMMTLHSDAALFIDSEVVNGPHFAANAAVPAGFAIFFTAERFIGNLGLNNRRNGNIRPVYLNSIQKPSRPIAGLASNLSNVAP